jgi:micrococcal nuclease
MEEVKRAIDGDTIELSTGEKVRLIGVDTLEMKVPRKSVQYSGKAAAAFTQRTVAGKRVRLEYDQQRQDKYGRTLAYVYLESGIFVNAEIIRQGYRFAYTRFPFKYQGQFRQLEREAWGRDGGCGEPNDGCRPVGILAGEDTKHEETQRQHRQPYVGRGVRGLWRSRG